MGSTEMIAKALGELSEANKNIAETMRSIDSNLKTLNDNNILHMTKSEEERKSILDKIKTMTDRYWWLIIALLAVLLLVLGYKEAVKVLM
jgi:hypothetical protein